MSIFVTSCETCHCKIKFGATRACRRHAHTSITPYVVSLEMSFFRYSFPVLSPRCLFLLVLHCVTYVVIWGLDSKSFIWIVNCSTRDLRFLSFCCVNSYISYISLFRQTFYVQGEILVVCKIKLKLKLNCIVVLLSLEASVFDFLRL